MSQVRRRRHIAKTLSYRILSTASSFLIVYAITGSFKVGTTFSIFELVYKPLQYYIHERIWYKHIRYGVEKEVGH
jgi:uncharacterized membrane protein